MSKNMPKHVIRTLPLLLAAAYGGAAMAQSQIEEVIVTAQKRQEKLQEIPLSITAISGAQLETRGIEGIANLNALAPSMMFRSNPGSDLITTLYIRGSGTSQPAIWVDPAVAMYVDGAYIGKAQGAVFDVVELERVEVLRGPQGTLFGRNTESGAVNMVSRRPSGVWGGSIGLEVGNYGHAVERIALDLPQMGIAKFSIGMRKEDRDGWAKNTNGKDLGARDKEAYRLAATLDFTKDFKLDYTYDKSDINNTSAPTSLYALSGSAGGTFQGAFGAFLGGAIANAMAPYVRTSRPSKISLNGYAGLWERSDVEGHALTLNYKLNDHNTLKYIFTKRDLTYNDRSDIDGTPLNSITYAPGRTWGMNIYYDRETNYDQKSHELQWIGDWDKLKYVFGAYYFEDEGWTRGPQDFSMFGFTQRSDYGVSSESKAVFGQLDYNVTDRLTATLGMRHSEETKDGWVHAFYTNGFDGPFVADRYGRKETGSKKFTGNSPMAALAYKLDETTNLYGRIAKGFKSGGWNVEVLSDAAMKPYKPQTSTSFEVGIKKSFLDNRAQINAAIWDSKIKDLHVTQLVPATTVSYLTNAGEVSLKGLELEGTFIPADGWKIQASYGYMESDYKKYMENSNNLPGHPLIDTSSNKRQGYAPKHTLALNVDGRLAKTPWGTLRGILDYTYTDTMYLYTCNVSMAVPKASGNYLCGGVKLPSTETLNARLLLAGVPIGGPGSADISLWVRNLTNEDKMIQGIDFGLFRTANWQEPRTYGLSFNYKW